MVKSQQVTDEEQENSARYEFPEPGYYQLPFAQATFALRLDAIADTISPGSSVVDLGCNDGRIARHLLERGLARQVVAVDLIDMIPKKPAGFTLIVADLGRLDFKTLPPETDVVLFLNLVHHLVNRSCETAKAAIHHMLSISSFVLLDMGSFTEQGPWSWRREYERYWANDKEMWDDLFQAAASRRPVMRYAAQNGGSRVLWRLSGRASLPPMSGYRVAGRYRRTVSSIPQLKQLVKVRTMEEKQELFGTQLGQLCPDVIFHLLEGEDGTLYWAKKWLNEKAWLGPATQAIESFLRTLGREDLCLAVDVHEDFGLIYPFNEELFASSIVAHQWDRRKFFDAEACAEIEALAATMVIAADLPRRPLGELTDFQAAQTRNGLVFLDFEPAVYQYRSS